MDDTVLDSLSVPPPGVSLSAMERAVPEYRKKITTAVGNASRSSARVDGFRDGWQACIAYLKSRDTP